MSVLLTDHLFNSTLNLQGGEDKHHGEVDLDDHGEELVCEHVDQLAQEHQHPSWQGHLVKLCLKNLSNLLTP